MSLRITIHEVQGVDTGIWRASVAPGDFAILGHGRANQGEVSVLLLLEHPVYNASAKTLVFDPKQAYLLNSGRSSQSIILDGALGGGAKPQSEPPANRVPSSHGDSHYLQALPSFLKDLGSRLLQGVRNTSKGELKYYPTSGKYVETPNNFWTVRIQPRDRSLRITLRGEPDTFKHQQTIHLKHDMRGYSSFKISESGQLAAAIDVIGQAAAH